MIRHAKLRARQLVKDGWSTRDIANETGLSIPQVKRQRKRVRDAANQKNRAPTPEVSRTARAQSGGDEKIRAGLKPYEGQRLCCTATVERIERRSGYGGSEVESLLLTNVRLYDTDKLLTDHIWKNAGKWSASLRAGQEITFEATVATYKNGYRGWREDAWDTPLSIDYTLNRPRVISIGS